MSICKSICAHADTVLIISRLVVDTGDLHDGNGLSDTTSPNGAASNSIFEKVNYDLLTIGNHELYISDVAYLTATKFAKAYGERYLTSNVQVFNNATQKYEYPGKQYRYFKTKKGLRIMAMGFLYDFTGNSNASKVIKAADAIQQPWFSHAVNYTKPIDLFVLMGHNALRNSSGQTISTIQKAIRQARPNVPIQIFGGHTHIRDFAVYDSGSTGLESGRYCETLGWVAINGIKSKHYKGSQKPKGVPHPSKPAVRVNSTAVTPPAAFKNLKYARRYLDWNRLTFAYHATGSQSKTKFDTEKGIHTSKKLTQIRKQQNLTSIYGCVPQTWCLSCEPFGSPNNIYTVLTEAVAKTVINQTRADKSRLIILNTGSVRFDLVEGPFTVDDSFIVNPFNDAFQFLPDVPYANAQQVLGMLNKGPIQKREDISARDLTTRDFKFTPSTEQCLEASAASHNDTLRRREIYGSMTRGHGAAIKRNIAPTAGYVTKDDFGNDGDDTIHSQIPLYLQPNIFQANASFPIDGSSPDKVDFVFLDFIRPNVLAALASTGLNYSTAPVTYYITKEFDTHAYLPAYAKLAWQKNVPNCPIGKGVGST